MALEQPVCRYLRTKKMYIPALQEPGQGLEDGRKARYWCLKTMAGVGPDDDFVGPPECQPHRQCFASSE